MGTRNKFEEALEAELPRFRRYLVFRRFMRYVAIGDPCACWQWQGPIKSNGYGGFWWGEKRIVNAHVAAYELFVGKRHGLYVCHSCDNPGCVNPSHLWLGTQRQNYRDMVTKGRGNFVGSPGETNPRAELTWKEVRKIRKLHAAGVSCTKLARRFGRGETTICHILKGRTWIEPAGEGESDDNPKTVN